MVDRIKKNYLNNLGIKIIIVVVICFMIMKDIGSIAALRHLAAVFLISFFIGPYMPIRALQFPDGGFGLKFGLGLFICFYPAWLLSALGLCEYSDPVIFASFLVLAILGFVIKKYAYREKYYDREEVLKALNGFAVFAVIFLIFFWIIGFNPLINHGTEKYMDYGFIQTIYRQKAAIPMDIWFSGQKLNYYYFGQSICVCLIRLSMNTPEYGYNMILATIAGMVFLMVYELVTGISGVLLSGAKNLSRCASLGGIIGAILAAFGSNPHWVLYGIIIPAFGGPPENEQYGMYWYPDASTYIRAESGDPDNGKVEFPSYSLIIGDLHAHVLNLLFVLPLLALLFDLCLQGKGKTKKEDKMRRIYALTLISMLLGYYKGSNYWDFVIYFLITGAVILFCDVRQSGMNIKTLLGIGAKGIFVTLISMLTVLPFTLSFNKMVAGIALCKTHTPIAKFLVLWFLPVTVSVGLIVYLYSKKKTKVRSSDSGLAALLALTMCTIGLIITPEVLYIDDIYTGVNERFNTMFKLAYQAFILFAILAGIAFAMLVYEFLNKKRGRGLLGTAVFTMVLYTVLAASYLGYGLKQSISYSKFPGTRLGISALEGLRLDEDYVFELQAMDLIRQDERKVINIVEAPGDSYSHQSMLSVVSGACTTVGWFAHEWLWQNDVDLVSERTNQTASFYCMGDTEYCREYLKRYDVDYVFVGPAEVSKYPVNINGFAPLGEICLSAQWKGQNLVLVRIDKSKL